MSSIETSSDHLLDWINARDEVARLREDNLKLREAVIVASDAFGDATGQTIEDYVPKDFYDLFKSASDEAYRRYKERELLAEGVIE